jgi:hypothetical protein
MLSLWLGLRMFKCDRCCPWDLRLPSQLVCVKAIPRDKPQGSGVEGKSVSSSSLGTPTLAPRLVLLHRNFQSGRA